MLAIFRVLYSTPTHPPFDSDEFPPRHTIVTEADIFCTNKEKRHVKVNSVLRHRIVTTCGNDNVKYGTQQMDPALCLYVGVYLMCVLGNKLL